MPRLYLQLAAGLTACGLLVASLPIEPAYAQQQQQQQKQRQQQKKKPESKPPAPPKDGAVERAPFTEQEANAAVVLGIPNARAFGDSETDFARLLPQVTGPWLAVSGGGADGAFGAGLLTGWSQSGNRPEFAVVTGVSIGSLIAP